MMRILVVDNRDSFVYNLVEILRHEPCQVEVVECDRIDLEAAAQYDKFLLSPGAGVPSEYPQMRRLITRYASERAFLGVCLGHQALAEAFGARLYQLSAPRHGHTSRLVIHDRHDPLFRGVTDGSRIGRYHSWVIDPTSVSDELRITALDEQGNIMAIRHRAYPIFGVQFHPESIITDQGIQMISNWVTL